MYWQCTERPFDQMSVCLMIQLTMSQILDMSQQLGCHGMWKIWTRSDYHFHVKATHFIQNFEYELMDALWNVSQRSLGTVSLVGRYIFFILLSILWTLLSHLLKYTWGFSGGPYGAGLIIGIVLARKINTCCVLMTGIDGNLIIQDCCSAPLDVWFWVPAQDPYVK